MLQLTKRSALIDYFFDATLPPRYMLCRLLAFASRRRCRLRRHTPTIAYDAAACRHAEPYHAAIEPPLLLTRLICLMITMPPRRWLLQRHGFEAADTLLYVTSHCVTFDACRAAITDAAYAH